MKQNFRQFVKVSVRAALTDAASKKQRCRDILNGILIALSFTAMAGVLSMAIFSKTLTSATNVAMIYMLSCISVSLVTPGYLYGFFAAALSVFSINYLYTFPYMNLNFTLKGYPLTFLIMTLLALGGSAVTSKFKRMSYQLLEKEKIISDTEKEKLRANLLRAVSHDLRTPLAGIIGASSSYLEMEDRLTEDEKRQLISNIKNDGDWLLNMVDNLLSVTRIGASGPNLKKHEEAAEDVAAAAVQKIKQRNKNVQLKMHLPDTVPTAPMDPLLIEQVLINLLQNSINHSRSDKPIDLIIEEDAVSITFRVRDSGVGLGNVNIDDIFSGRRSPDTEADSHKGAGIGLSICKTIIKAHNGSINAKDLNPGAEFYFTLPKEDQK